MAVYPSLKARRLLAMLATLGYTTYSQSGSHRKLRAEGLPSLTFAFHDGVEVPPGLVRKILLKDVGLTEAEAERLLGMKGSK